MTYSEQQAARAHAIADIVYLLEDEGKRRELADPGDSPRDVMSASGRRKVHGYELLEQLHLVDDGQPTDLNREVLQIYDEAREDYQSWRRENRVAEPAKFDDYLANFDTPGAVIVMDVLEPGKPMKNILDERGIKKSVVGRTQSNIWSHMEKLERNSVVEHASTTSNGKKVYDYGPKAEPGIKTVESLDGTLENYPGDFPLDGTTTEALDLDALREIMDSPTTKI